MGGVEPSDPGRRQPPWPHPSGIEPVGTGLRSPPCRADHASGRGRDSNPEPSVLETDALPVELPSQAPELMRPRGSCIHLCHPRFTGDSRTLCAPPPVALARRPASHYPPFKAVCCVATICGSNPQTGNPPAGTGQLDPSPLRPPMEPRPGKGIQTGLAPAFRRAHGGRCTVRPQSLAVPQTSGIRTRHTARFPRPAGPATRGRDTHCQMPCLPPCPGATPGRAIALGQSESN